MHEIKWERYPRIWIWPLARAWLVLHWNLQFAPNTIDAYGRGLEDFLSFCSANKINPQTATREHISLWVNDLGKRPNPNRKNILIPGSGIGLSYATKMQKLTAVRLFFDYLCEEGIRKNNPVSRTTFALGRLFRDDNGTSFLRGRKLLPWIPTEDEWARLHGQVKKESLRNRLMFVLQYDCALRREELCLLRDEYFDPVHRSLHIPGTITKSRRSRVVHYSEISASLYLSYLNLRRTFTQPGGFLFRSESRRNYSSPITIWSWSKIIRRLAKQAYVIGYTTHTARHLRLTDLARAGWDIQEIAAFAGHRMIDTTLKYIHLSGRDMRNSFDRTMAEINRWRQKKLKELISEKDEEENED